MHNIASRLCSCSRSLSTSLTGVLTGIELLCLLFTGDDDTDELVPLKLKETKRFRDRKVIGMEIGGQMLFLLAVQESPASQPAAQTGAKTEATGATAPAASAQNGATGASDAPPEPVPMDATS